MRDLRFITVLVVFTLFLFLFGLGNMALTDPDETFYAQSAKEMLSANEWVTPTIFGQAQFEKPVLFYWLIMVSYLVFGVGEFAARFPSVIFGIAGVIGIYFLGKLFFSRLCGFLSGMILATCVQYIVLARGCVTDMVLMTFILLCLLFFLKGWLRENRYYFYLAAVMAALAVLTKGPIGLFIPGMIGVIYIAVTRDWKKLKKVPFLWCIVIFAAVCLPWYLKVSSVHGTTFIGEFFGFQNVTRFLEPEHKTGTSPFFYIPIVLGGFFPWSFFLPAGVWGMWKIPDEYSRIKGYRAFLLIWFLVVFLFFSISRTKLVTYIFPLFPVLAIVTGRVWERFIEKTAEHKGFFRHMTVSYYVFMIFTLLGFIGLAIFVLVEYPAALMGTLLAEICFIAGFIISFFLFKKGSFFGSVLAIMCAIFMLSFPLVIFVLPEIEAQESSKAICYIAKTLASEDEPIAGESDNRRGVAFYADRVDVPDIQNYQKQIDFFSSGGRVWGIIKMKHYKQLKKNEPDLMSEPIYYTHNKVLVTNKASSKE